MARIPLYLLLLILPLAVAGHNIGTSVIALMLFAQLYLRRKDLRIGETWQRFKVPLIASFAYIAVVLMAGFLNPSLPARVGGSFFFGFLIWALLPPVVYLAQDDLDERDWRRLMMCLAVVVAVMGGVAATQAVVGFKLVGAKFVPWNTRAQGFYSHPLTFAYVALLFLPLGCAAVAAWPRRVPGWVILLGSAVAIYASQSRTVQAVAGLIVLVTIWRFATGRMRIGLLVGALTVGTLVMLTDNPVSARFGQALRREDVHHSEYRDDRLVFWRVAWEMIQERPVIGHGENIGTEYRTTYYDRLGFTDFPRKYEAHNMYLQVLVNGGIVALVVFLWWLSWYFREATALGRAGSPVAFGGRVATITLGALCLAAMTQNAFQDSEVRYAITLVCTAIWLMAKTKQGADSR